jgi:hypothetical protein
MEPKELLSGVLVKAQIMTDAEVSSLFKEDGTPLENIADLVQTKQNEIVKKLRDTAKGEANSAFARGVKEKSEEWEKLIADAGVNLDGAKGEEAVQKLRDHIAEQTKPSDLDDDKVKTSKAYRDAEKAAALALANKDKEWAAKLSEKDTEYQRERTLATVKARAEELKSVIKPVLPDNPEMAKRQLRLLDMDILAVSYDPDADGTILLKGKDGNRLEKANGQPMTLDEYLEEAIRSNFPVQVSDPKGSVGDPTKGTIPPKGASVLVKPASRKAYADKLYEINNDTNLKPEEKVQMAESLKELSKDLA